jgi:hypothetical protein
MFLYIFYLILKKIKTIMIYHELAQPRILPIILKKMKNIIFE